MFSVSHYNKTRFMLMQNYVGAPRDVGQVVHLIRINCEQYMYTKDICYLHIQIRISQADDNGST